MRALSDKINDECNKSKTLRELSWNTDDEDARNRIRDEQQEHWDKFQFFKNLGVAIDKKKEY